MRLCSASVIALLAAPQPPAAASPTPDNPEFNLEVVTVDAVAGACPSATEVTEALNARIPRLAGIGPAGSAPAGGDRTAVRLTLTHGDEGSLRVELIDPRGAVALERTLAVLAPDWSSRRSEQRNGSACAALADTVSLIVDRYMRHVGYHDSGLQTTKTAALSAEMSPIAEPAPPGGVRAVLLGAGADLSGAAGRPRAGAGWTEYVSLSFALHWQRLAVTAGAALGTSTQSALIPDTDAGTFKYVPLPVRLSAGLRLPWRGTVLIPQIGAGADLLFTSSQHVRGGHFELAADPIAEAGGEYLIPLGGHTFLNARAGGVLNLRPHDFWVTGLPAPIFRMPRLYARAGLQLGFVWDGEARHALR
jgi:hypothetical protein